MGWAADIVLDDEKLTPDILAAIRLNKDDVYKSGSNGDLFLTAVNRLQAMDPTKRPKGEELMAWLGRECGVAAGLTQRFKTVIMDPTVSPIATAICRTNWGRQGFQIGHFDDLCGAKVKQVRG